MYTKGIRTTRISLCFQDFVPQWDALEVERVKQAGAVILGKTNTPEFGLKASCENRIADGKPVESPDDSRRIEWRGGRSRSAWRTASG